MAAHHSGKSVPTISVLVPVFNAEEYVGAAIDSVLSQTFDDLELLLFDDGSSDQSLSVLRAYERRDSRIRVYTRENHGIFRTRNELVALSRGKYLAVMDADDICMPSRLARQYTFLESSPDHVAVSSWVELINGDSMPISIRKTPTNHADIDAANLEGRSSMAHPAAMIRKEGMLAIDGYDSTFQVAGDLDLWLRLAEVGKLANLPEVLLRYRVDAGGVSELKRVLQRNSARRACKMAWERRGIAGQFELADLSEKETPGSRPFDALLQYGWTSWRNRNSNTWRSYSLKAIRMRPLSSSAWRLLIFGFFKSPPKNPD